MIVLDVKQHSAEWHFARLGIPTASNFSRILTRKKLELAAGSETYKHELLAEWLTGIPSGGGSSGFMERGTAMESWAVDYYEFQREVKTQEVGLCMREGRMVAASPDRLVGDDGGLEIKCPSASKHVANLLDMTEEHFAQVQGNMWIAGREWWDLLSYHPEMPSALQRIRRDEKYIEALDAAVGQFVDGLLRSRDRLLELGAKPATALAPDFVAALATHEECVPS